MSKRSIISIISLCCFLIFSTSVVVWADDDNRYPKFDYSFVSYSCYESSFDPHYVLDNWVLLGGEPIRDGFIYVMMGNPKIEWGKYQLIDPSLLLKSERDLCPKDSDEGCIDIQVIYFIFNTHPTIGLSLLTYFWLDSISKKHEYAADIQKSCYSLYTDSLMPLYND